MYRLSLLALLSTARLALAGYSLADDYLNGDFFSKWNFFTDADPTQGYVNYVDQSTAQSSGYIKKNDDGSIYLGVDYTNVASGRGRNSVRLSSSKTYTHYLTVIDLAHMPGGICGTWPAFWSFGNAGGWPNDGEIDIIEGANDQQTNFMSLHTSPGCQNTPSNSLVPPVTTNCDVNANANEGCTFHDSSTNTYGSKFNAQGGGTYAAEWNSDGVNIWFWPQGGAPADALGDSPDPSGWGAPRASWGGSGCDWDSKFQEHNLVFDTTFCGSWAGNAFQSCSAANNGQTCNDFVKNNPAAFKDAYWQVKALKVYQSGGTSTPPKSSAAAPSPSAPVTVPHPVSTFATSSTTLLQQSSGGVVIPGPVTTAAAASSSSVTLIQQSSGGVIVPSAEPTAAQSSLTLIQQSSGGIFLPGPKHTTSSTTSSTTTPAPTVQAPTVAPQATSTPCAEELAHHKSSHENKSILEEEQKDGEVYRPGTWYSKERRNRVLLPRHVHRGSRL